MKMLLLLPFLFMSLLGQGVPQRKAKTKPTRPAMEVPATHEDTKAPGDVLGYQATRWGMSVDEVSRHVEMSTKRIAPATKHADGWIHLRGVLEVNGITLEPFFIFDEEGRSLKAIRMPVAKRVSDGHTFDPGQSEFEALYNPLLKKYGTPTRDGRVQYGREVVWRTHTTTITLSHLNFPSFGAVVDVAYEMTISSGTEKL